MPKSRLFPVLPPFQAFREFFLLGVCLSMGHKTAKVMMECVRLAGVLRTCPVSKLREWGGSPSTTAPVTTLF
jgi:hypothetical protein